MGNVIPLNELKNFSSQELQSLIKQAPRPRDLRSTIRYFIRAIHGLPEVMKCDIRQIKIYAGRAGATTTHLRQRWNVRFHDNEFLKAPSTHAMVVAQAPTQRIREQGWESTTIFYNTHSLKSILEKQNIGDWSLLREDELEIRPDIIDLTARDLFEIKPYHERGHQEGLRKVQMYLVALNRAVPTNDRFSGGKAFEGEILLQFAQGNHIWRLEWCTTTPGVALYRWTRSQERFDSNSAAYQSAQWVEISEQELKQYGGWVAQAVEEGVNRRERLATLSSALGLAIDIAGEVAMVVISTAMPGKRGASLPEGKVLPFPSKPSPTALPVQLPKASGM